LKAIILGNTGFIGSEVHNQMKGNVDFNCVGFSSCDLDLSNFSSSLSILKDNIDDAIVIFCAGKHRQWSDSFQTMLDNINIIDVLIRLATISPPKHIIFLSSIETYGIPKEKTITEKTQLNPQYNYSIGKVTCEMLLTLFCKQNNVELSILRLPGIYGKNDRETSIISKLVQSASQKKVFNLFGDGKDLRDYVYIEDLVRVILNIAYMKKGVGIINIATGNSLSINYLIKIISGMFGKIEINKCDSETAHYDMVFDNRALINLMSEFIFKKLEDNLLNYKDIIME
jgi:UDP-glucose 4-epimerase